MLVIAHAKMPPISVWLLCFKCFWKLVHIYKIFSLFLSLIYPMHAMYLPPTCKFCCSQLWENVRLHTGIYHPSPTHPPSPVKSHKFSLIIKNKSSMHNFTHSTTVRELNVKHFKQIQMQWIIHDAEDKFSNFWTQTNKKCLIKNSV